MTQQQAADMLKLQYLTKLTILDFSNCCNLSSFNIEWAIECLALSKGNPVILPKKIIVQIIEDARLIAHRSHPWLRQSVGIQKLKLATTRVSLGNQTIKNLTIRIL